MKKTYNTPSLEVIRIQTQQMLALSAGFGDGVKGGGDATSPELYFDDEELEGYFGQVKSKEGSNFA